MQTITIEELHARTGEWVRRAAEEGEISVTDEGRTIAVLHGMPQPPKENPFLNRKTLPGFAELQKRLVGGTDSTQIISEDRDGR
jgi:antitoxin (DNA-binding transcriptional repressor) of toxin-antitoxin stability system